MIEKKSLKCSKEILRVLYFDPTSIYLRLEEKKLLNPFQRNCKVSIADIFPPIKGVCSCGCGKVLTGRQTRWGSKECSNFGGKVFEIINGYTSTIRWYLSKYCGGVNCCKCTTTWEIEIDHLHPVVWGRAGCWLTGYQMVCRSCHRKKTNQDFKYKSVLR